VQGIAVVACAAVPTCSVRVGGTALPRARRGRAAAWGFSGQARARTPRDRPKGGVLAGARETRLRRALEGGGAGSGLAVGFMRGKWRRRLGWRSRPRGENRAAYGCVTARSATQQPCRPGRMPRGRDCHRGQADMVGRKGCEAAHDGGRGKCERDRGEREHWDKKARPVAGLSADGM